MDSVEHPQVLRVRLKASKTDPFRVGGTASGAAQQLQGIAEAKVRPMEEQRLPA